MFHSLHRYSNAGSQAMFDICQWLCFCLLCDCMFTCMHTKIAMKHYILLLFSLYIGMYLNWSPLGHNLLVAYKEKLEFYGTAEIESI